MKRILTLLSALLLSPLGLIEAAESSGLPSAAVGPTGSIAADALPTGGSAGTPADTSPTSPDTKAAVVAKTPWGLHVQADGTLTLAGEPFYGIGLCFYDGFLRTLRKPPYKPYAPSLKKIAASKIPFIRMPFSGFWPDELKRYQSAPEEYFREMDLFVKACEENHIGIIATLFWTKFSVSDVVGETVNQIGNPASKTMEYTRTYVRDVVTRYQNSPAIWGWEIGNEFNLAADLDKQGQPPLGYPYVLPARGTPAQRGPDDRITSQDVETYFTEVEKAVRSVDPYRIISNGTADFRGSQYNLRTHRAWRDDTEEELKAIMNVFSPRSVDTISVHITLDKEKDGLSQKRFNRTVEIEELLKIYVTLAKQSGKVLYMGEFHGDTEANFVRKLDAIQAAGMQLCSLWNFADEASSKTKSFSDDSFMFTRTAEANQNYRSQGLQKTDPYWPKRPASSSK